MNYEQHYHEVYKDDKIEGSHAWIQWKGTNACMDMHCKCGYSGHLDESFAYYYECSKCKQIYALSSTIKLIELNKENAEFVKHDSPNVIKTSQLEVEE